MTMQDAAGDRNTGIPDSTGPSDALRVVLSADILLGAREIIIRHGAEDYRLRLTRAGKLILNK